MPWGVMGCRELISSTLLQINIDVACFFCLFVFQIIEILFIQFKGAQFKFVCNMGQPVIALIRELGDMFYKRVDSSSLYNNENNKGDSTYSKSAK